MEGSLTDIPGTVSSARMGRPPLNVRETKVRLSDEQRARIIALVGKHKMAAFIRDAVDHELARRCPDAAGSVPATPPKPADPA